MWSYLQYKAIGRDIERERAGSQTERAYDLEGRLSQSGQQHDGDNKSSRTTDGQGLESSNDIAVGLECENDPFSPRDWSLAARSKNIAILTLLISVQAWAGAADSMANTSASMYFHVSKVAQNLSTAMYLFGIGSGCMVVGPLSETVGRNPTYLISTFCFLFFVLGTALAKSFGGFIVCRYLTGVFSSATLGINGASVKDQFRPVKRAFVFPIIAWANVAPPVIAPIAGGWIASNPALSWRWMEWITLIISGSAFVVALLFLPETYLPVLLDWKAKHLRRVTSDKRYVSEHAEHASFTRRLKQVLPMSARFLREPVIAVLGGYLVLLYILLFTFLSGFEYVFKHTYNLSDGLYGSCFAAIAVGATVVTLTAPGLYSWARHHTEYVRGAKVTPEFRLWPAMITAPLLPISLFWLGWTNYPSISIWSGLTACFFFGAVLISMYVGAYEYIIDSYGEHAAVALASITMARYLIAGGMVMAARPMFETLGVHWTLTLLGCVAAILTPGPFLLYRYGEKLRVRSPYAKSEGF
ncbi:MFS general substrate transporter [Rhizodiscina lignyota]|uniref:MFS general substrate transporter n=1 Tax=Rhizodiscina lignyota TaxID=1504668 RepID=A0A9P4IHD3_9PEZI|nr:MFS general substrate transporter [Rhizodiscina lignyota]